MGTRKGFIFTIALGSLAVGCGQEQQQQEDAASTRSLSRISQRSIDGWIVLGLQTGTGRDDEFLGLALNERSEVYVSGYEGGVTGISNVEPAGDARGLIVRYDPYLDEYMETRFNINALGTAEVIEALTVDPASQEVYFAGRTTGSFAGIQNQGQFDNLAGWIDGTGTPRLFQWGTAKPQHPRKIALAPDKKIIVSGYDDIYIPSNYVESVEDPFITKLERTTTGGMQHLWTKQFNTGWVDLLPGMTLDDSGNIYVTGSNSAGTSRGMFVRKYDSSGTQVWNERQSTISFDSAASVSLTGPVGTRSIIFAGSTFSLLGERQYGEQDVVVRKLSLSGGPALWTRQYGTTGSEWVTDMATDPQGNIYVVGETTGQFDPEIPNQGGADIFLMKLDPDGMKPDVLQLGSSGDDHPSSVITDACGNVYVAGYTTGSLAGGDHLGGRDAFVMRVTPPNTPCFTTGLP
ncbi:SBBP repeat-containing protein [Archangium gephyra]|uniref:SBBP repeat-containing protein n=1 Tax=Archangium gephyra TaxID=48 RepID=UPI0035D45D8A